MNNLKVPECLVTLVKMIEKHMKGHIKITPELCRSFCPHALGS